MATAEDVIQRAANLLRYHLALGIALDGLSDEVEGAVHVTGMHDGPGRPTVILYGPLAYAIVQRMEDAEIGPAEDEGCFQAKAPMDQLGIAGDLVAIVGLSQVQLGLVEDDTDDDTNTRSLGAC
jgi:hypothetical protein